jgi:hypothetical protein
MEKAKRIACLGALALGLVVAAWDAAAATVNVTVGGVTYTLTASPMSYTTNQNTLKAQPWWGNEPLAASISGALQYQLGDLLGGNGSTPGIPSALLGYGTSVGTYVSITYWNGTTVVNCPVGCPDFDEVDFYVTAVTQASTIPTLSDWAIMVLAALTAVIGIVAARRMPRRA